MTSDKRVLIDFRWNWNSTNRTMTPRWFHVNLCLVSTFPLEQLTEILENLFLFANFDPHRTEALIEFDSVIRNLLLASPHPGSEMGFPNYLRHNNEAKLENRAHK
jgi:hypothetical protein